MLHPIWEKNCLIAPSLITLDHCNFERDVRLLEQCGIGLLHIDILDAFQRQCYGSRMMDALTQQLRAKGVSAVMLVVGSGNKKGRSFYLKYGFEEVRVLPGGVVMGLKLL